MRNNNARADSVFDRAGIPEKNNESKNNNAGIRLIDAFYVLGLRQTEQ